MCHYLVSFLRGTRFAGLSSATGDATSAFAAAFARGLAGALALGSLAVEGSVLVLVLVSPVKPPTAMISSAVRSARPPWCTRTRFLDLYRMPSRRGPRLCCSPLPSTSRPSMPGAPTVISSPFRSSSTRPSFSDDPGSAERRSTRILSPGATRYCLPPLTTTADSEESGLGTASDCTKGTVSEDDLPAPERNGLDEAQRRQRGDRRGSPVRDQRQRDSRDRQQADVHSNVLDDLDEDHHEHAAREQLAEPVRRHGRRSQEPDQQQAEHREQHQASQQAELLGEDGEDEVGRAFGHKAELALKPVQPSLAEQAARPHRDPRLKQVVAGAERVLVRVEKDLQAPALVAVEQVGQQGQRYARREDEGEELPRACPGEEQHAEEHGQEDDRGAEVGLGQDQAGPRRNQEDRETERSPRNRLAAAQISSKDDHKQELRKLRRFEGKTGPRKSGSGAQGRVADEVHRQQDEDHAGVETWGERAQASVVEGCGGDVGADSQQQPQQLPAPIRLRAVHGHQTECGQHPDEQKLQVVEPAPGRDGCQTVPARMAPT